MKKLNIDILCTDGSPLGVSSASIFGEDGRIGIGGAELALLTMCEAWHNIGHRVRLYNNPSVINGSKFEQLATTAFDPDENRDILIIFRSPNAAAIQAKGLKVWWSCDQHTIGDFSAFANHVDKIITISPYHTEYLRNMYGIQNAQHIDLPVRYQDYVPGIERIPNRCIFTSIPDRGLMQLHAAWPMIVRDVPDATLVITSDWRLWDPMLPADVAREYRLHFATFKGVKYLGAINRRRLVQEQQMADVHLYPGVYEELFCISVAESQAVGAYPISSDAGALRTTNMGTVIKGNPYDPNWIDEFVQEAVTLMQHPDKLHEKQEEIMKKSKERFHIDKILEQWQRVFDG